MAFEKETTKLCIFRRKEEILITSLPYVPLVHIFSFLNIKDKMKCTRVCRKWRDIILSFRLWKEMYPTLWLYGQWQKLPCSHPSIDERMCNINQSNRLWMDSSYAFIKLDGHVDDVSLVPFLVPSEVDLYKEVVRECKILTGFIEYIVPHVGRGILKCDVRASNVLNDAMLNILLLSCPNLMHLDVSYTNIAGNAFEGLCVLDACTNLQHLNFTCCYHLSDTAILNLTKCWIVGEKGDVNKESENDDDCIQTVSISSLTYDVRGACTELMFFDCNHDWTKSVDGDSFLVNCEEAIDSEDYISVTCHKRNYRKVTGLCYLNMSGCTKLTDKSLYNLAECKTAFRNLEFLDVSGSWSFSSKGLKTLVNSCPSLKPEKLYYCTSIQDGPFNLGCNGCNNVDSSERPCCSY